MPPGPAPEPASPLPGLEERLGHCRTYLLEYPPAVSGEGGHARTFGVAGVIAVGFDLPEEQAWAPSAAPAPPAPPQRQASRLEAAA